jgi:hypothetical protein
MWIINHEDLEFLRDSSDGPVNIQKPLAAQTGLYFQPYCASLPMPAELLSRFVVRPFPSSQFFKTLMPFARRFKLLGTMMAKALHDGRAFPIRISYALARCICGQMPEFDDLSSILNFHLFTVRLCVSPPMTHS